MCKKMIIEIRKNNIQTTQYVKQVAAWNGEVRLEGLRFKPDAFESLNLPLRLDWGTVGRFHLTVPWKALGRYKKNYISPT